MSAFIDASSRRKSPRLAEGTRAPYDLDMPRGRRVSVLGVLAFLGLPGCAPSTRGVTNASPGVVGGEVVAYAPRVCVEVYVDNVRRARAGERGMPRTRALEATLAQALGVTPRGIAEDPRDHACEHVLAEHAASAPVRTVAAGVAPARARGIHRTLVVEITTRLVCEPSYLRSPDVERCVEESVVVTGAAFDARGEAASVARLEVGSTASSDEEQARQVSATLLGAVGHGSIGSRGVAGACRMVGATLDCT